jgi:hypothetical protein
VLLIAFFSLAGSLAHAQDTTGNITGTVTDASGAVMPGVTVTAASPILQGTQTAVTNPRGQYRVPSLPPGTYKLTFELSGFATMVRQGIAISIGFTANVDVQMALQGVSETVTVSGQAPVVDAQNTNIRNAFNAELLQTIPNAKDIWSVIAEAPGMTVTRFDVGGSTAGTQTGYTAYGSSDQNRVQIGGVNTTEGTGSAGYYYDYGAFDEISIGTSNAADAQMPTPGVNLNAVLKSGGNEVHGTSYFDYENESLQGNNVGSRLKSLGVGGGARMKRYLDGNFNMGGPITRDRLWYFTSIRYQEITAAATGFPVDAPGTGPDNSTYLENATYKLTYRLNDSNKFSHFLQMGGKQMPHRGADATLYRDAPQDQEDGAWAGNIEWNRLVSPAFYFELRGSTFGYNWPNYGYGPDGETYDNKQYRRYDNYTGNTAGAFWQYRIDVRRYQFDWTANLYRDDWGGASHNFKFGWTSEHESTETERGGYRDSIRLVYRSTSGIDFATPYRVELYNHPTTHVDKARHHGLYVNDQIQVNKHLTFSLGLRWDYYNTFQPEQTVRGGPYTPFFYDGVPLMTSAGPYSLPAAPFAGQSTIPASGNIITFKRGFAPRTGLSWNVRGDGRTLVKASWGRFYSNPSTGISDDINPIQNTYATFGWLDRSGDRLFSVDELGPFVSLSGGVRNSVQEGLGQGYTDEANLWLERELAPNLGLRAGFIYKRVMHQWRLIDVGRPDTLWTVPVQVVDPGVDGRTGTADDGTLRAWSMSTVTAAQTQYQAPGDNNSYYKNIDVTLTKRMSGRWSMITSFLYTWRNQLYSTGPPTPNVEINNRADSTLWTFKLLGTYRAPWDVLISPVLRHQAGTPVPRLVSVGTNAGTFSVIAEPVGSYRQDNITLFDTQAEKQFNVRRGLRLGVYFALFNIFNSNSAQNQDVTTGLTTVTVDGAPSTVQRFLRPTTIIGPRIARLGFKVTF